MFYGAPSFTYLSTSGGADKRQLYSRLFNILMPGPDLQSWSIKSSTMGERPRVDNYLLVTVAAVVKIRYFFYMEGLELIRHTLRYLHQSKTRRDMGRILHKKYSVPPIRRESVRPRIGSVRQRIMSRITSKHCRR